MEAINRLFALTSKSYNSLKPHYARCFELVLYCHNKLTSESSFVDYGYFNGQPPVHYSVFSLYDVLSRPIRSDIYIGEIDIFTREHNEMVRILRAPDHSWSSEDYERTNKVVYTAIMSLACCFDLWQRSSRKTPGTFFEIYFAGLLQEIFPEAVFSKHIPLVTIVGDPEASAPNEVLSNQESDETSSVSTDIVMGMKDHPGGIVVPLKITTRERIVQPFAHQRILNSRFGDGYYRSVIVCISETQLEAKTKSVKQVCAPGTIKLFQRYLAPISGLYYCDLPQRYASQDMMPILNVKTVGHVFEDLRVMLIDLTSRAKAV